MKEFIDPWASSMPEDYKQIVKKFGLNRFDTEDFPNPNVLMSRGFVFAGRDLKKISDCIRQEKPFYALTGIMPTADKVHFGTKSIIDMMVYFQKQGAEIYVLVADLEAAATRGMDLKEARKIAIEIHIPCYIALGLDVKKTKFYFQSENDDVRNLAFELSNKATLNEYRAIYGNAEPSRIMASILQVADILHPQIKKKMPGIIPVGIDQDPHIRLSRDIAGRAKKFGFVLPSSINVKFLPSLSGSLKMSKSEGNSLYLLDSDEEIKKKVSKALTGGQKTAKEQEEKGGNPEKDMLFELFRQHLIIDDKELKKREEDYRHGKILDSENKEFATKLLTKFMCDFRKKYKKARKQVN
ncbi:tryptophan--tRNA ligase, partial [Candidatus Pacearchaeota archaeon]|nr:tryptophan--tRNA ligase [Candidatus Pacearchaeota archaeon]